MKYYLLKYKNGLFAYKGIAGRHDYAERIRTFRLSDGDFFNIYCICCTMEYFAEKGYVLFESVDLDEIVERAALEAL